MHWFVRVSIRAILKKKKINVNDKKRNKRNTHRHCSDMFVVLIELVSNDKKLKGPNHCTLRKINNKKIKLFW